MRGRCEVGARVESAIVSQIGSSVQSVVGCRVDSPVDSSTKPNRFVDSYWPHPRDVPHVKVDERTGRDSTDGRAPVVAYRRHVASVRCRQIEYAQRRLRTHGEVSADQREALLLALDQGYFATPRESTLDEMAEKLDITKQALSVRIRRANEKVLSEVLLSSDVGSSDRK